MWVTGVQTCALPILGEFPGGRFVAEAACGELFAEFVQPGVGLRMLRTQPFDLVFLPEGERDGRQ